MVGHSAQHQGSWHPGGTLSECLTQVSCCVGWWKTVLPGKEYWVEHSSKPYPQATLLWELLSVLLSPLAIRGHNPGSIPRPHNCFSSIPCGLALHFIPWGHPVGPHGLPVFSADMQCCPKGPKSYGSAFGLRFMPWLTGKIVGLATLLPITPFSWPSCSHLENRDSRFVLDTSGGQGLPSHSRPLDGFFPPLLSFPGPHAPSLSSLFTSGSQQS